MERPISSVPSVPSFSSAPVFEVPSPLPAPAPVFVPAPAIPIANTANPANAANDLPVTYPALPPPLLSLDEKLSLVALGCFGMLASFPAFLLGGAVGFICYEVIDGAVQRNHYYPFIRKTWNEADVCPVVSIAMSAMWVIKQVGPLLSASSVGAGIYVGVRVAKYIVAKYASRAAAPL